MMRPSSLLRFGFIGVFLTFVLIPLYWVVITSIKPSDDYLAVPPVWFPAHPTLVHYVAALFAYRGLAGLLNSLIVASATTVLSAILGTCMGYSFVRFNTGGKHLALWVLSQRFLPPIAIVLPIFLLYRSYGLYDTRAGLVLAYTVMTLPLSVWMMYALLPPASAFAGGSGVGGRLRLVAGVLEDRRTPSLTRHRGRRGICLHRRMDRILLRADSDESPRLHPAHRIPLLRQLPGGTVRRIERARRHIIGALHRAGHDGAAAPGSRFDLGSSAGMNTTTTTPDIALRLYGEPRATAPARHVAVGGLSFTLEGMALRWIRRDEVELLRGIAFVVRDRDWGTYRTETVIEQEEMRGDLTRMVLSATIGSNKAQLICTMRIEAGSAGLTVIADATASGDFETNRTGFVILHSASCAGESARVEHTGSRVTQGHFPKLIRPHQPFMDMRAIEHQPVSGMTVTTRFEGEVFEMEDQRNWSDASFKIYSRPLALPFPYVIRNGETARQNVQVTVTGTSPGPGISSDRPVAVRIIDQPGGYLPRLGIGGRPQEYVGSDLARRKLAALQPSLLLVELDPPGAEPGHLDAVRAAQAATGAGLVLMLRRHHGALTALAGADLAPSAVALVGADTVLIEEARRVFPGARVGAGTDAFFAEFNRTPPVAADFVFWTVNPTVHAEDDASVMETLGVLGDQAATARAHCPGVPLWCGPVTLRMRFNPNATGPVASIRPGMPPADVDARQRGLFGAAFTLGQIAAWARAGIETLFFYTPFGPLGVIHSPAGFSIPWYDGQHPDGIAYPAYHVLSGLAPHSGARIRSVEISASAPITALAVHDSLWLANLGSEPVTVATPGERVRVLDAESFVAATLDPDEFWHHDGGTVAGGVIQLNPYSVARLSGADLL